MAGVVVVVVEGGGGVEAPELGESCASGIGNWSMIVELGLGCCV